LCASALQIDRKALTTQHLLRKHFLKEPTFLGEHPRNRRLRAGQTQRQAATEIGVLREVYDRWERDKTEPPVGFWKWIIAFVGSCPMPQNGGGTADLVFMAQRVQGLSQYALASELGEIAKSVLLGECESARPDPESLKRLRAPAGGIPTSA
jgi:DNA-binding XRE family transcriptional regulator